MNIRTISRAMTILVTLAFLFSMPTASGQAAPAYGATIEHTYTKGYSIMADWEGINGDIFTFVNVFAADNTTMEAPQPGGPQKTPMLIVAMLQYNIVTGIVYFIGSAETTSFSISVAEDLSTAQVQADFGANPMGTPYELSLSVNLTGTGELAEQKCKEHFSDHGFVFNFHSNGLHRDATATGIVSVNGVNLTPGPAHSGHIHYAKEGSVLVQTP